MKLSMLGRTLAHYLILEKVGAGGMGVVYRARDTQLDRLVALKVVGDQSGVDTTARARLLREARTASALNHPNICTIHGAGEADGETFIAMELVEGQPLSEVIPGDGLPIGTAVRYAVQIADALAHAHERGVVHRDLKGANVIITPEGRPKVLDFGLARRVFETTPEAATRTAESVTEAGMIAGTLSHMAPELLRGETADARSDLWALGVLLYHAVTGLFPFHGSTTFQVSSAVLRDSPPPLPPRVPPQLAAIILRLLAKPPGERYQRAGEVRAAIETIQSGLITATNVPVADVSRRRWMWIAGAAAAAAAGTATWSGIERSRKPPAAPQPGGPRLSDGARPSQIPEANEYYERALQFGSGARQDVPQQRRMLERALEIDPRFAAAQADHGFTYAVSIIRGDSNDATLLYKAEEECRQALQLDPLCGRAHSALALICLLRGRKELVPAEAGKAIQGNPNDPTPHSWIAFYHQMNDDYSQAMRQVQFLTARWPLYWPGKILLGELLLEQGDAAGAIRTEERLLGQDPRNMQALSYTARAHMELGDLVKTRQALERARPEDRQNYRLRLYWALLLALEGKKEEALREVDVEVEKYIGTHFRGPVLAAEIYAVLGDVPKALEYLDRAGRIGDDRESWLRRDALLVNLRGNPRFQQILASMAYRRSQRPAAAATKTGSQ